LEKGDTFSRPSLIAAELAARGEMLPPGFLREYHQPPSEGVEDRFALAWQTNRQIESRWNPDLGQGFRFFAGPL
jgi:hypothetical protein